MEPNASTCCQYLVSLTAKMIPARTLPFPQGTGGWWPLGLTDGSCRSSGPPRCPAGLYTAGRPAYARGVGAPSVESKSGKELSRWLWSMPTRTWTNAKRRGATCRPRTRVTSRSPSSPPRTWAMALPPPATRDTGSSAATCRSAASATTGAPARPSTPAN